MNLESLFGLRAQGTRPRTEMIAGATTFMTMSYILVVNPSILAETGMDRGALFTATACSAALATLVMGLYARLPFALAPGMGLNAFFAYTVCLGMGFAWQLALTAVFVEGILFMILTVLNLREAIINCIPLNLKKAIAVGIGLFIAFVGLRNAGIVVTGSGGGVGAELGDLSAAEPALALLGLLVSAWLMVRGVSGALLIGILLTAAAGLPLGVTHWPEAWGGPPSLAPLLFQFQWDMLLTTDMAVVLVTFLFVDMFDTAGTLIGVAAKTGLLDERGRVPRARQALLTDAIGTTCGACLGTSTVTVYVESAAGIAAGGRTGLTAVTCAVLFLAALFLAPVFLMIPAAATAPALLLVGLMMMSPIKDIDLADLGESLPAFLTIILMPASGSIATGIMFGVLTYVGLKVVTGQGRRVAPLLYGIAAFFLLMIVLK